MRRRAFLQLSAASLAMAGLSACGPLPRLRALGIPVRVIRPGMAQGHGLRDTPGLPTAQGEIRTDIAILGSGIAGLTAAWRLARSGHSDFILLSGPEPDGNAATSRFATPDGPLAAPRGAHYLPLPSRESGHVREMLADLGVIEADPQGVRPTYDEAAVIHAPHERLWYRGAWREELLPSPWVAPEAAAEHRRFEAQIATLRTQRGADGRKVFAIPLALASSDPVWRALDRQNFAAWLAHNGYTEPSLLTYLDYACRDDYGAGLASVSAWAGLHYFAARDGQAANAEPGSVLTWPEGLGRIATGLGARIPSSKRRAGHALRLVEQRDGVRILCLDESGRAYSLHARRAICAMPLHIAARVIPDMRAYGFDSREQLPASAPWLVGNILLRGFPGEGPGVPLAWDNVIHGSASLGWVVSTHQDLRAARPAHTVFTTYHALASGTPQNSRAWLTQADDDALLGLALGDLEQAYAQLDLWRRMIAVELTVRGHAMATPNPGFLANPGLENLRQADGRVVFAHSDLSGYSVFEEAAWWGDVAASKMLDG
jgi:hypothetical protein